jgi:RHS repeat-associated protein
MTGTYHYDLDYRPTTRVDAGSSAVQNLSYGYFTNNSVHTINDAVNAANSQSMTYDTLDRLKTATSGTGGYGSYSFTWDPVGNIKTEVINGTTTTYHLTAGTNRLSNFVTGTTTENVTTSASGNITKFGISGTAVETLTYNKANELATAATSAQSASYAFDEFGKRLKSVGTATGTSTFQYFTDGTLLTDTDGAGNSRVDYIYLNGRPIGTYQPSNNKFYFISTDRLGTPSTVTDSTQAIAWSATYQPFGNTGTGASGIVQNLRLPGQEWDLESTFNHNGFRDYATTLTRYVQTDPIGLAGGMNTYQYAKGNPFKFTDRSGLVGCPSNTVLVCVADAPEIPIDASLPKQTYQPAYNFGGVGYGPADPDNPNSGDTKWMRYNCNYANGGTCSFIAPGVGYDGHGVETQPSGNGSVPVNPAPFVVDSDHPTGDVDQPFLKALKKNYQCMPTGKPKP